MAKRRLFCNRRMAFLSAILLLCVFFIIQRGISIKQSRLRLAPIEVLSTPHRKVKLPTLVENAFVTDVIWVPHEHRFVVIALTPTHFRYRYRNGTKYERSETHAFNHTFPWEVLSHPAYLEWWVDEGTPVECMISKAVAGDHNIDNTLFIATCPLEPQKRSELRVGVGLQVVAELNLNVLNALHSYVFRRPYPQEEPVRPRGIAICVKTFHAYSRFVLDMVRYFKSQGFSHVYLGVQIKTAPSLISDLRTLLVDYLDFVSIGTLNTSAVSFKGPSTQKMPFINSVLFHSKSFDRLLMVHDVDEAVVSMMPGVSASDALLNAIPKDPSFCFINLYAHSLPNRATGDPKASLTETFPTRCDGGSYAYTKSVAVVAKSNFASLHMHDRSCPWTPYLNRSIAMVFHFSSFWSVRTVPNPQCNISSEFSLPAPQSQAE